MTEIIAVLGDVVRRMRLLKGVRAAIGRKGFDADLKVLASATSEELVHGSHDHCGSKGEHCHEHCSTDHA